jgi:hypothetical protein
MTACSSQLTWISMTAESAWAENSQSTASQVVIPHNGRADVTKLTQAMIDSARAKQYRNEVPTGIVGPMAGAEFTFQMYIVGHGTTTSGATTATDFETTMAWIIGAGVVTAASGTTIAGVSTVTSLATTSSGQFAPGGLLRVGVKNDGRADGQWSVVDTCVTTTTVVEAAFAAAPTTGTPDVVFSAYNAYTKETSCDMTSKRFFIKTADTQWCLHGCFLKSYTISGYAPGELPMIEVTVGVSWFEPISATFPDTTALSWTTQPVPVAAGQIWLQVYGTTTYPTSTIAAVRSCSISVTPGVAILPTHAGVSPYQVVGGATRTPDAISVSVVLDAGGASANPTWWANWLTNARWHLLAGLSTAPGAAVACYLPNLTYTGNRPTQMDGDGVNRVQVDFKAGTDTAETASELSLSAMRWGFA